MTSSRGTDSIPSIRFHRLNRKHTGKSDLDLGDFTILQNGLAHHYTGLVVFGTTFVGAMIPAAGAVVDAAGQFEHAIVRFPKGAKWADLIDRKTPGWEGFKQLGILKGGSISPL